MQKEVFDEQCDRSKGIIAEDANGATTFYKSLTAFHKEHGSDILTIYRAINLRKPLKGYKLGGFPKTNT